VDYSNEKPHVEKGKNIVDFEREGSCAICHSDLKHEADIYTICPNPGCETVTHLTCLSQHFLKDEADAFVPVKGQCPTCKAELRWVDVVKELSLRMRGQNMVEKLLKGKRVRKGKAATAASDIDDREEEDGDEMVEENGMLRENNLGEMSEDLGDAWHEMDALDDSDTGSIISNTSKPRPATSYKGIQAIGLGTVIEDSDWDDAEILD
jgi:structure-specific endonuclease subunit SLX1